MAMMPVSSQAPRRSRKVLITAAVVLGVILAGGLAALALKDRSSGGSAGAPKIIAADEGPTKIQPAVQPAETDGQQNKLIYDRADPDTASPDQLVLPDEARSTRKAASNETAGSREISRIILPGGPGGDANAAAPGGAPTDARLVPPPLTRRPMPARARCALSLSSRTERSSIQPPPDRAWRPDAPPRRAPQGAAPRLPRKLHGA